MLECGTCHQLKAPEEFARQQNRKTGRQFSCRVCVRASRIHRTAENLERLHRSAAIAGTANREQIAHNARAKRYGITPEELTALKDAWTGFCPICGREKGVELTHVDHDHETGKVRGLLCNWCNVELGWLEMVGLQKILEYLGPDNRVLRTDKPADPI